MTRTSSPDLLETIVAATRRRVEIAREADPPAALERRAAMRVPRGDAFRTALAQAGRWNVIAECKRRSPSRGVLRHAYDPVAIAQAYERGGAVALSVLTEPTFFDGSLRHLETVREAVSCPLLRKDFIVDEYQLLEARSAGADAVLLIVAALSDGRLADLQRSARAMGLAALVEVHDVEELDRAVSAGARDRRRQQSQPAHARSRHPGVGDDRRADAGERRRGQRKRVENAGGSRAACVRSVTTRS